MLFRKIEKTIREHLCSDSNKILIIDGAYVKIGLNQEKPYKTRV